MTTTPKPISPAERKTAEGMAAAVLQAYRQMQAERHAHLFKKD